jgi:NADH dehydrogenase [ubiquinone] 1 alpha subcomplex assembly factor 5
MNLHWINDLTQTFESFKHTMKDDGLFMGSLFGGDTL